MRPLVLIETTTPPMFCFKFSFIYLFMMGVAFQAMAAPLFFKTVESSSKNNSPTQLNACIDGIESGLNGWSASDFNKKQEAIFLTTHPENASTYKISLFFLSGRPLNAIAEFAISATNDPNPSLAGNWVQMNISRFSAENANLQETPEHHLRANEVNPEDMGVQKDAIYFVTAFTALRGVTGFRIEAFPVIKKNTRLPAMSWGIGGNFILTEFQVEPVATTNVALNAPVKASHPLWHEMKPGALTDGLPSTIAHPAEPGGLGSAFYFQIDLGASYPLDHIGLLTRNVPKYLEKLLDRLSRVRVQVYEQAPEEGGGVVWEAIDRADGSHPESGTMDVLHKDSGKGTFHGRYLRISSDNPEPLSPQLAEVEVYPTRTLKLIDVRADGRELNRASTQVPSGVHRLALGFSIEQFGACPAQQFRWRLRGASEDWYPGYDMTLEIPAPAPGHYTFEAQAAHSDGRFDSTLLSVPVTFRVPFVQTAAFRFLVAGAILACGSLVMFFFYRRRMARMRAHEAIVQERARIARDIHDEVGARLSQLVMIQDLFSRKHAHSDTVRKELSLISDNTKKAIEALDEVVWTVNPRNDTLRALVQYLVHYAESYFAATGIACRTQIALEWPEVNLMMRPRQHLVFAFKEALQNVIKHAQADEIKITIQIENEHLQIHVADNGRGLPESSSGLGKDGLINIKSRLSDMGGFCEFKPRSKGGTEVVMTIPLKQLLALS